MKAAKTLVKQNNYDIDFIRMVLAQYKKHGRSTLPWRKNISAYNVLVSEIMLQQTQVARVLEKYAVWMKIYPTLTSFSKATLTEVLLLWQGLGYQRRAKALYEISQQVRSIPTTYDALIALPCVGSYTASAVCAFAYNEFSRPMIETNIRTVILEYFYKNKKEVDDKAITKILLRLEQTTQVKKLGAREWYYALMDSGAYLKSQRISHNVRSKHYSKQTPFKGSLRELRAQILFRIVHKRPIIKDKRTTLILDILEQEGYIIKKGRSYTVT